MGRTGSVNRPMAPPSRRPLTEEIKHPVACAILAVLGFGLALLAAVRDPVPGWELRVTEWLNGAPDAVADVLYPTMQLGTLAAPLGVAAAILLFRRDRLGALATIVAGLAAWFGAKAIKQWVERGRPRAFLPGIDVRESTAGGFGFISGHSAVAAAAVVIAAMTLLPRRFRPVALMVGVLVGLARVVHGVHLPADVVGGWCFGVLCALGVLCVVDRVATTDLDLGADSPGFETARAQLVE
jgi:glycosyltransferase 2 family protein